MLNGKLVRCRMEIRSKQGVAVDQVLKCRGQRLGVAVGTDAGNQRFIVNAATLPKMISLGVRERSISWFGHGVRADVVKGQTGGGDLHSAGGDGRRHGTGSRPAEPDDRNSPALAAAAAGCLAEFWATCCERPWQRVAGGRSHRHVSRIHDVLRLALNSTCAPWKLAITMRIADALIALMSP